MLPAQASRNAVDDRGIAGCAASLAIADRLTVITDRRASALGDGGSGCGGSNGSGGAGDGSGGRDGCTWGGASTSDDAAGIAATGTQSLPQRAQRTVSPAVMRASGTS